MQTSTNVYTNSRMTWKYDELDELNSIHWNFTWDDIAKLEEIHNTFCNKYKMFKKTNNNVVRF